LYFENAIETVVAFANIYEDVDLFVTIAAADPDGCGIFQQFRDFIADLRRDIDMNYTAPNSKRRYSICKSISSLC
jgi:hypothetical protein